MLRDEPVTEAGRYLDVTLEAVSRNAAEQLSRWLGREDSNLPMPISNSAAQ
jgi:hypothetical protein